MTHSPSIFLRSAYIIASFSLILTILLSENEVWAESMIPCTLKQTYVWANISCRLTSKTYCVWKKTPMCETTIQIKEDGSWIVPGITTTTGWDPADKTLYGYEHIPDSSIFPEVPADPPGWTYGPIDLIRPFKWWTTVNQTGKYDFKPPQIVKNDISCLGGTTIDPVTNIKTIQVSTFGCLPLWWINGSECTLSHLRRLFTLPSDQNEGEVGVLNKTGSTLYTKPADPNNIIRELHTNEVEWVYGLLDDGAPKITIEWIDTKKMFSANRKSWCNINRYIGGIYAKTPGCEAYALGWNVTYGEDLFKNLKIHFEDTSGISEYEVTLGTCTFSGGAVAHSCDNGRIPGKKSKYLYYELIKSRLGLGDADRIDTKCLAPGKNSLIVTADDDARSTYNGIQPRSNHTRYAVPWYIYIDNTPPKIRLDGDMMTALYEWDRNNSFTGCYLNKTWSLRNTEKWVNYSVMGNIRVGDPYGTGTDTCSQCNFIWDLQVCANTDATPPKPEWPNTHSIWTAPLGIDPRTGHYAPLKCWNVNIPTGTSCAWDCDPWYSKYQKSDGTYICGESAICGTDNQKTSMVESSGRGLCERWIGTQIIRTGSWWNWYCESKDAENTTIDSIACRSYFPGQAICSATGCSDGGTPSCEIHFHDYFGSQAEITSSPPRFIGDIARLSWDSKNVGSLDYICTGIQVPWIYSTSWNGTMQAGAGLLEHVTFKDNVSCKFSLPWKTTPLCTYTNNQINIHSDIGTCGPFQDNGFADIPIPTPSTSASPSNYCTSGALIDFTDIANLSGATFTNSYMSGQAHKIYNDLTASGYQLGNWPFLWWCQIGNDTIWIKACVAGSCLNGSTYNPITGRCDGECAEWSITIIHENGEKECISCEPFPEYTFHMSQYGSNGFACYYYSSNLMFPIIGKSNDDPENLSGSYWHGNWLWKDYSTFMNRLYSLEQPKELVEGEDIVENTGGSLWTQEKYDKKFQYILGTWAAIGSGQAGFDLSLLEWSKNPEFPKTCFANGKYIDPDDVWIILGSTLVASNCKLVSNEDIQKNGVNSFFGGYWYSDCPEEPEGYTGGVITYMHSQKSYLSIAKPNSQRTLLIYTIDDERLNVIDSTKWAWASQVRTTNTYSISNDDSLDPKKWKTYQMDRPKLSRGLWNWGSINACTSEKDSDCRDGIGTTVLSYQWNIQPSGSLSTSEITTTWEWCNWYKDCENGTKVTHFNQEFLDTYVDAPFWSTCIEETPTTDFTAPNLWCRLKWRTLWNCSKTLWDPISEEYKTYRFPYVNPWGQEYPNVNSTDPLPDLGRYPVEYQHIYPWYWPDDFDDNSIATTFIDGLNPTFYQGNLACWISFDNSNRRDYIGMIHYAWRFAHNNMVNPYAYVTNDHDGKPTSKSREFRKNSDDMPDALVFWIGENGACSTIGSWWWGSSAPMRKKPKIKRYTPKGGGIVPGVDPCDAAIDIPKWGLTCP